MAFGAHVGGLLGGLGLIGVCKYLERRRGKTTANEIVKPGPMRVEISARREIAPAETPTIYLHDGGVQSGPFTMFQIEQMLTLGSISRDALYWSEGMTDWASVLELSGRPSG